MAFQPITAIVVHSNPHADEDLAYLYILMFGAKLFGKASHRELRFISAINHLSWDNEDVVRLMAELGWNKDNLPCELDADALEKHGVLFVGTGGGRFDEHPTPGSRRKENISCARLIADALGDALPAQLEDLTEYIDNEDTRQRRKIPNPLELSSLIRVLQNNRVQRAAISDLMARIIHGRMNWPTDLRPSDLYDEKLFNRQVAIFLSRIFPEVNGFSKKNPLGDLEALGYHTRPELEQLVKYLHGLRRRSDSASLLTYELACLPMLLSGTPDSLPSDEDLEYFQWLFMQKYEEQKYFHVTLRNEYDACKDVRTIHLKNGKKLLVSFVETAKYGLDRVARKYDRAGVIVIRNPETGNVQILSSLRILQKLGIGKSNPKLNQHSHLDEVAKLIRIRERQLAGAVISFDPNDIIAEGAIDGAENWWFDRRLPVLMNGSRSAPNTLPTRIEWEKLKELVMLAMDEGRMTPSCVAKTRCDRFGCTAGIYSLYLNRCYDLRDRERTEQSEGFSFGNMTADTEVA